MLNESYIDNNPMDICNLTNYEILRFVMGLTEEETQDVLRQISDK